MLTCPEVREGNELNAHVETRYRRRWRLGCGIWTSQLGCSVRERRLQDPRKWDKAWGWVSGLSKTYVRWIN